MAVFVSNSEVNSLSIITVAQDYGMSLRYYKSGMYKTLCPSPSHSDKHLGNCYVTDIHQGGRRKNYVKCFSCGATYSPIDLVMHLNHCKFEEAKEELIEKYNLAPAVDEKRTTKTTKPTWTGLNAEQYEKFGLRNVTVPLDGYDDMPATKYEKILLRNLAREEPYVHDEILINKFLERMEGIKFAYEICILMYYYNESELANYRRAFLTLEEEYKSLLWKGLMDKTLYGEIYETVDDFAFDIAKDAGALILKECMEEQIKKYPEMKMAL